VDEQKLLATSLVLLLLALPLISWGTWSDVPALWWAGVIAALIGALIPPVARFVTDDEDEEDES